MQILISITTLTLLWKRCKLAGLVYILLMPNLYAQKPENPSDLKALPRQTITINPLGVLQFGPIFQGEFKVTQQGYFTSHVRLPYLGVLYHVLNANDDSYEVTVSPVALGLGAGYKSMFPTQKGAWYVGGVFDYSFGSSTGNDGSEWKSEFSNLALMANGGFRWRWPNKKNIIGVGAYLGYYFALRDEWWYINDPGNTRDERSTTSLLMLELSFGWER